MAEKAFKTIDEQLDLLRSRGLTIDDESKAKQFLLYNNYYRISGYSLTLRSNDRFFDSASFQNIIDIYCFDQEFRHIILQYLEIIEVKFKSIYAYEFTKAHGPTGHLDKQNFTNEQKYNDIIDKSELQKNHRLPHEAYLKHYINDLQEDIPLWAYVDLFTISDISILFSITEKDIQDRIAKVYGLTVSKASLILSRYMHSMTIIRNLCAHGSRIFNRLFEQKPSLSKKDRALLRINADGTIDNSHFYGFLLIMRRLLSTNEFYDMKSSIIDLSNKYPFVRLDYYGFRDNWENDI